MCGQSQEEMAGGFSKAEQHLPFPMLCCEDDDDGLSDIQLEEDVYKRQEYLQLLSNILIAQTILSRANLCSSQKLHFPSLNLFSKHITTMPPYI